MLENVHALPGSERHASFHDGNPKLRQGQRRADVRRHIVGTFHGVAIEAVVLRHQPGEERVEIVDHVGIGVLLNGERGGGVLDEHRQQARFDGIFRQPAGNLVGELVQTFAARRDLERAGSYSTVTLLARLRG